MARPISSSVTGDERGHHATGGRNVIPAGSRVAERKDVFFAAVQMSRMPMCLTDPDQPDDPIVFCNQAFEELTGYSQHDVIGRNCRFLQGELTDRATVAEIRAAIEARQELHVEILNYRKNGSLFWNALFISPVIDTDGNLIHFFASQLDVTKRREAEAVFQQSQRLETLGAMASSLAHEFNNLMTIVLANLERLGSEHDAGQRRNRIERASEGARKAARLTDQMLSFARRQFHDSRVIDVNVALAHCDAILDRMAGGAAIVQLDLAPAPLQVSIDAGQLEMALLNLVRNAADAGSRDGRITIATRAITGAEPGVEIAISDTGAGMPPDVARRATEPFFTTKELGKGTGLGLSMVKGFVEQSDGSLHIESRPGAGTTVRMVFPAASGA